MASWFKWLSQCSVPILHDEWSKLTSAFLAIHKMFWITIWRTTSPTPKHVISSSTDYSAWKHVWECFSIILHLIGIILLIFVVITIWHLIFLSEVVTHKRILNEKTHSNTQSGSCMKGNVLVTFGHAQWCQWDAGTSDRFIHYNTLTYPAGS